MTCILISSMVNLCHRQSRPKWTGIQVSKEEFLMFTQVKLTYDFNALEPHIDTLTMETHYGKHHAAYTANLNKAVEQLPELKGKTIEEILTNLDDITDTALRTTVRNNGGGFYNHNLYFAIMAALISLKKS